MKSLRKRFFAKVNKHGPIASRLHTRCWLWTAATTNQGYGKLGVHEKTVDAHRVSWLLHKGPVPVGLGVLHKCDVKLCVNPKHLFTGTQKQNIRDACAKRRMHHGLSSGANTHPECRPCGQRHGYIKKPYAWGPRIEGRFTSRKSPTACAPNVGVADL